MNGSRGPFRHGSSHGFFFSLWKIGEDTHHGQRRIGNAVCFVHCVAKHIPLVRFRPGSASWPGQAERIVKDSMTCAAKPLWEGARRLLPLLYGRDTLFAVSFVSSAWRPKWKPKVCAISASPSDAEWPAMLRVSLCDSIDRTTFRSGKKGDNPISRQSGLKPTPLSLGLPRVLLSLAALGLVTAKDHARFVLRRVRVVTGGDRAPRCLRRAVRGGRRQSWWFSRPRTGHTVLRGSGAQRRIHQ